MGPADAAAMTAAVEGSPLHSKYAAAVDRESAREILAARLEAGAVKAREEKDRATQGGGTGSRAKSSSGSRSRTRAPQSSRSRSSSGGDMVSEVMKSPMAKDLMRTAAREITRGLFRVGRR
jgi:hypothetical protein